MTPNQLLPENINDLFLLCGGGFRSRARQRNRSCFTDVHFWTLIDAKVARKMNICIFCSFIMHQSIPPAPSPPPLPPVRATAGHLPALSVPRVGYLQILHCPGAGHLPTPGPFPSFWHTRGLLSEYNYTEGFTRKKADCGSSVKDRDELKGVIKACSRFYVRISSLLIKIT